MPAAIDKPFPAYSGDRPYVFVCYAHADAKQVYADLTFVRSLGVNVWYDEGITPGSEWSESLAAALRGASQVLFFASPRSAASRHCRDELRYARDNDVSIASVHLEPTELSEGLKLSLNAKQAILRYEHNTPRYQEKLAEVLGSADQRPATEPAPAVATAAPKRYWSLGVALAGAAAVAATALFVFLEPAPSGPGPQQEQTDAAARSVAVLPFVNLSSDPGNEFFADGLTDTLIHRLSRLDGLQVTARTSSFAFKGSSEEMQSIARKLGVAIVLDGSVQRSGDNVRVFAKLTQVGDRSNIWSEQFDMQVQDIFSTHDAIATSVARAMELNVLGTAAATLTERPTDSMEAYRAYLLGLEFFERSDFDSLDESVGFLEQAIVIDPGFAQAHVALAHNYITQFIAGKIDAAELRTNARPAINLALELAPALAEGYAMRGLYRHITGDPRAGQPDLEKALVLNPNSAISAGHLGGILALSANPERAVELTARARQLDPVGFWPRFDSMFALQRAGLFEQALAVLDADASWYLFFRGLYHWQVERRHDLAIAVFERGVSTDPRDAEFPAYLSMVYLDLDRQAHVAAWRDAALAVDANHTMPALASALYELQYGDRRQAVAIAERALARDNPYRFEAPEILLRIVRDHYLDAGQPEAALAWYQRIFPQLGDHNFGGRWPVLYPRSLLHAGIDLSVVLDALGQRDAARAMRAAVAGELATSPRLGLLGYDIADVELKTLAGEHEAAIALFGEAVQGGWGRSWRFHTGQNRNLDAIRHDPRFALLMRELEATLVSP